MKWIKELDEEASSMKGQPIYMTCELSKEKDVTWKKNGQVLKKREGKVQINIIGMQHTVTIQNSTEEDAGTYTCEVDGMEDVKTTSNVKVIGKRRGKFYTPINRSGDRPIGGVTFRSVSTVEFIGTNQTAGIC